MADYHTFFYKPETERESVRVSVLLKILKINYLFSKKEIVFTVTEKTRRGNMNNKTILDKLEHIEDQLEKKHYLNILVILHELNGIFIKRFNNILKNRGRECQK